MRSIVISGAQWADQFSWLEELALKSSVLLLVAFALTTLLKRRHHLACATVWNATLLGLLILPAAVAMGPRFAVWTSQQSEITMQNVEDAPIEAGFQLEDGSEAALPIIVDSETAQAAVPAESDAGVPSHTSTSFVAPLVPMRGVAVLAIGLGMCFAMPRLLFAVLSVLRLRRSATPVTDAAWLESVSRWCGQLGIRRVVSLRCTPCVDVPIVVGAIRPTILLPVRLLDQQNDQHIDAIVAHELAHVRRGDYAWQLLLRIVQGVYWYHPLIWLAEARIAETRERACDEFGVYAVGSSERYAATLLSMAERMVKRPATSLGLTAVRTPRIAGRLEALKSSEGSRVCRLKIPATLLCLCVGLLVTCGLAGAVIADDTTPAEQPDEATAQEPVADTDESDPRPFLTTFSDSMRTNVDRIETWSGTYRFSDRIHTTVSRYLGERPGEAEPDDTRSVWKLETGTIDFEVDVAGSSFKSIVRTDGRPSLVRTATPPTFEDIETGETVDSSSSGGFQQVSIVTPDAFVEYRPNSAIQYGDPRPNGERASGDRVVRNDPENGSHGRNFGSVFNPMDLFTIGQHDLMTHERFERYVAYSQRDAEALQRVLDRTTVRQIGAGEFIVNIWYSGRPDEPGIVGRWTIDESRGFFPVRFEKFVGRPSIGDESARMLESRIYEYTEEGDIRLPTMVRHRSYDEDGKLDFERTLDLVESELNRPLTEDTFSIDSLPLKDGDRVVDEIAGTEQVSLNGELIPLSEYLGR